MQHRLSDINYKDFEMILVDDEMTIKLINPAECDY